MLLSDLSRSHAQRNNNVKKVTKQSKFATTSENEKFDELEDEQSASFHSSIEGDEVRSQDAEFLNDLDKLEQAS